MLVPMRRSILCRQNNPMEPECPRAPSQGKDFPLLRFGFGVDILFVDQLEEQLMANTAKNLHVNALWTPESSEIREKLGFSFRFFRSFGFPASTSVPHPHPGSAHTMRSLDSRFGLRLFILAWLTYWMDGPITDILGPITISCFHFSSNTSFHFNIIFDTGSSAFIAP